MDKFDKKTRSRIMGKIRSKNTSVEILLRKLLNENGLRGYRLHYKIIGKPDVAYVSKKIAIFIDGDFWHGYNWKKLGKKPPKNYWQTKIKRNMLRDISYTKELKNQGWKVLRFWEHDVLKNPDRCIRKIAVARSR